VNVTEENSRRLIKRHFPGARDKNHEHTTSELPMFGRIYIYETIKISP